MPALPLETAGPYVAAAYLIFLALVLIYVAIMAGRLARIDREIAEIGDILDRRDALTPATDAAGHGTTVGRDPGSGDSEAERPKDSPVRQAHR